MSSNSSDINIKVTLDENKVPESIHWHAGDSNIPHVNKTKAMMLALWDDKDKSSLKIDLWTKEMTVDEMYIFFHQTLLSMGETVKRATGDDQVAKDLREFADAFGKRHNLF
jgi:gliding motility-associated protein GldC